MKKWMSRFAVLAVVGTLLTSALVVGCGGDAEEAETTTPSSSGAANKSP